MSRKAVRRADLEPGEGFAMHRFDFDRAKPFPMSFGLMGSVVERSKSKIAPSRPNYRGPESFRLATAEVIVVAIDAAKGVTRHALEWALSNVVQPGGMIILLALLPSNSGWKFWKFTKFNCDPSKERNRMEETKKSCQCMVEQLRNLCEAKKVRTTVKIVPSADKGTTTIEAKKAHASWVVLDRNLKKEERSCSEQLQCNLVIVDRHDAKILRLDLKHSPKSTPVKDELCKSMAEADTSSSSPDPGTPFTSTDRGNSSCSESSTSPYSSTEPGSYQNSAHDDSLAEKTHSSDLQSGYVVSESDSDDSSVLSKRRRNVKHSKDRQSTIEGTRPHRTRSSPSKRFSPQSRLSLSMREGGSRQNFRTVSNNNSSALPSGVSTTTRKLMLSDLLASFKDTKNNSDISERQEVDEIQDVRRAVALPPSSHSPLEPPPLCSICQHKAPAFGRPPRAFTYKELELATGGFSQANFLAEGGFGSVHRGILPEGQVVAVKQHKLASSQGDVEFCSEVEVLSCAQHRNVVMLIGYCMEDSRRLLVYEFICNNSLDAHLYGKEEEPLEWKYRQRIATGAARGLRYLHEECRVGCIVHRDMRPNNILLTHDYEPMVGDFGLARWQPDGKLGVETRVIGTFGYLAPEYTQSGQITEKADVYSFGIVLLELVTGRKAIDISRPKGQQCLTEWARPLLRRQQYQELVDPKLGDSFEKDEVNLMLHAAFLCISRDPGMRPRMSQVLRILEGEMTIDVVTSNIREENSLSDEEYSVARPVIQANSRRSTSALKSRPVSNMGIERPHHHHHHHHHHHQQQQIVGRLTLEELKAAYRDKLNRRRLSHGEELL